MLCAENISDLFVNIFAWGRKGQNETIKAGPNIFWQKSIFLRDMVEFKFHGTEC